MTLGEPLDTYEQSDLYRILGQIIKDEDSAILVAVVDGQPIGLVEVYIRDDAANPHRVSKRHGYLQSLIVKEEYRAQGIGTRLVEAAQRWAKEKGAIEMRLETWEFEEGPLRFYEKSGYRTLRRTWVREL